MDEIMKSTVSASPSRKRLRKEPSWQAFLQSPEAFKPLPQWLDSNVPMGPDCDSPVLFAIRKYRYPASFQLIKHGADIQSANSKGVTPLILASQRGDFSLCQELKARGANLHHVTHQGTSAVLQAAHFGHLDILKLLLKNNPRLLELATYHQTSPLMRAAQEGHLDVCSYLLDQGALVNRKNHKNMTALMLASQRGNAKVCKVLINNGADLDAMTDQSSTALVLAAKRNHLDTCRILVECGCELYAKDSRGRTPHYLAQHKLQNDKLAALLTQESQIELMQQTERIKIIHQLSRSFHLTQNRRASIRPGCESSPVAQVCQKLPKCILQRVLEFVPNPQLFQERLGLFTKRAVADANAATLGALDVIDELLEEGGFCQACDSCQIPPPSMPNGVETRRLKNWTQWKAWCRQNAKAESTIPQKLVPNNPIQVPRQLPQRLDITLAQLAVPTSTTSTLVEWRRHGQFLKVLAQSSELKLQFCPPHLRVQLVNCTDICSLLRKTATSPQSITNSDIIQVQPSVAMNIILLASRLGTWHHELNQ